MTDRDDKSGTNNLVSRISVSLPSPLLAELDSMVASRGYGSRSQAVSDMVNRELVDYKRKLGNDVMMGTITLHYDRSMRGLQNKLADIQYQYLNEVISSLHVHLSENQVMEVLLVQGHAQRLQEIANVMLTRRGVFTSRLQVHTAIIPPIQIPGDAAGTSRTTQRTKKLNASIKTKSGKA